jgi:TonB family protein
MRAIGYIIALLFCGITSLYSQTTFEAMAYGGKQGLRNLIRSEMQYPPPLMESGKEAGVKLVFTIEKDGSVSGIGVAKSGGSAFDAEAFRILSKVLWEPARNEFGPQISKQSIEIDFKIKAYKRYCKQRGYERIPYPDSCDTSALVYSLSQLQQLPKPKFSNADYTYGQFIADNLKYPEAAFRQSLEGTVKLEFIIEPYGKVSNIRVLEGVGGGCSEEAVRLAGILDWHPGMCDNKAVRTRMFLSISFRLGGNSDFAMPNNYGGPMN